MKAFLWLTLTLNFAWGSALLEPDPGLDPVPQHLSSFQVDGVAKRAGRGRPVNIDLEVWTRRGVQLQWYGEITVGTPPQKLKLIFDTGASLMLIAHNNCTTCGDHVLFDPDASSTFSGLPGHKAEITFGSSGGGTVAGSEVQGANCTAITDTVRMAGRGVPSEFMICDNFSSGLREQPPDGLFGMGLLLDAEWSVGPNLTNPYKTIYWHLVETGQIPAPEFSFSFISECKQCGGHKGKGRNGKGKCRDGVLTLGGTDRSQYIPSTLKKIPLSWPLSESRSQWVVDVKGGHIGDFTLTNSTDAVTLVDTGTAHMATPDRETTQELYSRMSDQIIPLDEYGSWGAPCDVLDSVARDVTFTVGSAEQQTDVVVKKKYMNVGEFPGKPGICQGVFTDPGRVAREPINGRPAWIFGTPWLRSYYTVWNAVDRTLGFATPSHKDED